MKKKERIVKYTAKQIESMRRQGKDRTDWAKVDAMTDADIARLTKSDPDENIEWGEWLIGIPLPKQHLNLRIDADVLAWFKRQGPGYQDPHECRSQGLCDGTQGASATENKDQPKARGGGVMTSTTLDRVRILAAQRKVRISQHAYARLAKRRISVRMILSGVAGGEVIEDYPNYHVGPAVLVLQTDDQGLPLHVVWGFEHNTTEPAVIVTAYRPDPRAWSSDFKRRT
jgi:uncharacterized protein (DUF4415 family)